MCRAGVLWSRLRIKKVKTWTKHRELSVVASLPIRPVLPEEKWPILSRLSGTTFVMVWYQYQGCVWWLLYCVWLFFVLFIIFNIYIALTRWCWWLEIPSPTFKFPSIWNETNFLMMNTRGVEKLCGKKARRPLNCFKCWQKQERQDSVAYSWRFTH